MMVEVSRLVGSPMNTSDIMERLKHYFIYCPSIYRVDVYQSGQKGGKSLKMTNRQRYPFDLQEMLVVESINGN